MITGAPGSARSRPRTYWLRYEARAARGRRRSGRTWISSRGFVDFFLHLDSTWPRSSSGTASTPTPAVPDHLPGDGAGGHALPARRLAPLRRRQLRRARRPPPLAALLPLLRGRHPRRHRQLRDRRLPRAQGLPLPEVALLQPRPPAQDPRVLREVRGQDDHHRALHPHHPDLRPLRGRRREDELRALPRATT